MRILRFLIVIILFTSSVVPAKTYLKKWGNDPGLDKQDNIIALYKLNNWKIIGVPDSDQTQLPLYSDSADTISFINSFEYPNDSLIVGAYFKSLGFHGVVSIYINGNLISKQPNSSAPFRVKIKKKYLKDHGKNFIKIQLIKSVNLDNGFPVFTQLYTEPDFIGITRPFYIELVKQPLFNDFKYSLEKTNKGFLLNYSYKISPTVISTFKNKRGLFFEEVFSDSNAKIISRRIIPSSLKEMVVSHKITLLPNQLWTIKEPRFINVSVTLKRNGQTIEKEEKSLAFRNIESDKNVLFFNFEKIFIRGITYRENLLHEIPSNVFLDIKNHLSLIKKDGFNAIRFYGHIPDERYLSIADTLGLFIFVDLPVRRYPEIMFKKDIMLENLKKTISTTVEQFKTHPSFVALGIGQEILLSNPSTQKFYIILNGATDKPIPFVTYISPVPQNGLPKEMAADFYMLDIYNSIASKTEMVLETNIPYTLSGITGFSNDLEYLNHDNPNYDLHHTMLLKTDIKAVLTTLKLQGGFVESFMDWHSKTLSHQSSGEKNKLVRNGFYNSALTKYDWAQFGDNIWDNEEIKTLAIAKKTKSSNIFSIIMFVGSLIFFFFYKKYPRFSENYKRALKHPYGFYVDMRERRIIPIFNSFILAIHNSLIISIFIGSFVYFNNDSFLVQEIINIFIPGSDIYSAYLFISKSELLIIVVLFIFIFLHPVIMGIILKILGAISKNYVRFRQVLIIGLWTGAPFIFMIPLSFSAYHLLVNNLFVKALIIIFILVLIWSNVRLINGIRVLVLLKFRVIFLVLLLSYSAPLVIFGFFYNPQPMWYDYLITLLNSRSLF